MRRDPDKILHEAIASALARAAVRPGARILVALSGGADSVALLHAMLALGVHRDFKIAAAHLNHGLRGVDSDRDAQFAAAMCERLGVELVLGRASGLALDAANLEERARIARYEFLSRAANSLDAEYIALGHHLDDQAETFLMRLLRGSGASGLSAMAERGPGLLIRPMLHVSRGEIRSYLRARKIEFVEDSTNSSDGILRNRIRADLIPMLELDYAPGLSARLGGLADEMRSLDDLVTTAASRELDAMQTADGWLEVTRFAGLHPGLQTPLVRLYLQGRIGNLRWIARDHLEAIRRLILEGGPSACLNLPGRWRIERQYNLIRVIHLTDSPARTTETRAGEASGFSVSLNLDGITAVEGVGFEFEAATLAAGDAAMRGGLQSALPESLSVALFDAAKIDGSSLRVRNFIPGDRISRVGMRGATKVKKIFIDRKLPRASRLRFPIVTLGGAVAWLPGLARSRDCLINKATETVLRVEAREKVI